MVCDKNVVWCIKHLHHCMWMHFLNEYGEFIMWCSSCWAAHESFAYVYLTLESWHVGISTEKSKGYLPKLTIFVPWKETDPLPCSTSYGHHTMMWVWGVTCQTRSPVSGFAVGLPWSMDSHLPLRQVFAEGTWGIQAPKLATQNWKKILFVVLDGFSKIVI